MSVSILGLATASPDHAFAQDDALAMARARCGPDQRTQRLLPALYRRTQVQSRGGVALATEDADPWSFYPVPQDQADCGPTTGQRMQRYASEAPPLAHDAAAAALDDAGLAASGVTHLITVSCTGFFAPGLDASLIESLGLNRTVSRTHIGFMGCHGSYNAMQVARQIAIADASARVLVCAVELCSLHFSYGPDPQRLVANALFGDGAAALVISQPDHRTEAKQGGSLELLDTASILLPDSSHAMSWIIGDHGFEMTLSPQVPDLIHQHLHPWLASFLARHGVNLTSIAQWAIHPGGPRVVESVLAALDLPARYAADSRAILSAMGNMSSVTTLFILENMRQRQAGGLCVALGFGPGLVAETMLLRFPDPTEQSPT